MKRSLIQPIVLGLVLSAGAVPEVRASIITATNNGGGGGGLFVNTSAVATPNPGNGNVPGLSTNQLSYDEAFSSVLSGMASYTNVQGAATEYSVTLVVQNNTGLNWIGFECYTGAGTMTSPSYTNWFVFDFDLAPAISGPGTGSATWSSANDNWITFAGLNVPAGATIQLDFNLSLPLNNSGGWGILQRPVAVPTPGALALLSLGGLVAARRRR